MNRSLQDKDIRGDALGKGSSISKRHNWALGIHQCSWSMDYGVCEIGESRDGGCDIVTYKKYIYIYSVSRTEVGSFPKSKQLLLWTVSS